MVKGEGIKVQKWLEEIIWDLSGGLQSFKDISTWVTASAIPYKAKSDEVTELQNL